MASCFLRSGPGYNGPDNVPLADRDGTVLKPFQQTHLGGLPPELRVQIYIELLATPPSYAGHDFAAISPKPKKFVHIKASSCQVIRTCRQIYVESCPIFFAQKSYYFGTPQEAGHLIDYYDIFKGPILRLDTITAICLRNFVDTHVYRKETIDLIMSDPSRSVLGTRQELEQRTIKMEKTSTLWQLRGLKNLKIVSLCFPVGEEMLYVNLLYYLSALRRGLVEFIDASHWLIRPQNPEDTWSIQYACFTHADWGKGKDNEDIPFDRRNIELEVIDIDSRAPELKEGDERYVEVQILWPVVEVPAPEPRGSDEDDRDWENTSNLSDLGSQDLLSDVDSQYQDSHEALLEVPQDPSADNTLTEHSEYDQESAGLEPSPIGTDQPTFFGLDNEEGRDSQRATDTDQEENHTLLQPLSEDVPSVQAGIQSDPPPEDPPMSTPGALTSHDAPAATGEGRLPLLDTGDEDDQIETRSVTSSQLPHAQDMQHWWHNNTAFTEGVNETGQVQQGPRDSMKGQSRRSKSKSLSNLSSRSLPKISKMPCPYTDEEMESYERWQEQSTSGNKGKAVELSYPEDKDSARLENLQEHPKVQPCVQNKVADSQEEHFVAASQDPPRLLVSIYAVGVLLLLFLAHAIITYQSERQSNISPDSAGSGNQH